MSPHHSLKLCTKIKNGKLSKTLLTQLRARQLSRVMIRDSSNLSRLPFEFVDILVLSKRLGQYLGHCSYYDSHAIQEAHWQVNSSCPCILTCGVGVASLLGLVPDSHAIILQFEVALLLPGTRFDFPHYSPNQHGLEVVIPPDTSKK